MLAKILGCNKEKALEEIQLLLANPSKLTPQNVAEILERNGFAGLKKKLIQKELEKLLAQFLTTAAQDRRFSANEKNFYAKLKNALGISEKKAKEIFSSVLKSEIEAYIKKATEDGDWSPEEEQELLNFAQSFGVDLNFDYNTKELLDRLRFVWQLNQNILPIETVNIKLKRGETCHFKAYAQIGELKRRVISHSYSGPRISFRIAKGIYLSHGTLYRKRETKEVLEFYDEGDLYLTNKRLIFYGFRKTVSLPLNKILDVIFYDDGIQVIKERGKPLFFEFDISDKFCLLFKKLWEEA